MTCGVATAPGKRRSFTLKFRLSNIHAQTKGEVRKVSSDFRKKQSTRTPAMARGTADSEAHEKSADSLVRAFRKIGRTNTRTKLSALLLESTVGSSFG